jgi:four helix bundle protein
MMERPVEKGLESLAVWKKSIDFAVWVYQSVLPILPAVENNALSNQLRRAAQSIPANIAEGHGRYYYQEGVRFCYIARGSLEETQSHLTLAHRLGYLSEPMLTEAAHQIDEIRRMLNGYIAYLKQTKRGASEAGSSIHENEAEYASPASSLIDLSLVDTLLPSTKD